MIDEKSFGEEENKILEEIIKKNSIPIKDNFFDYYNEDEMHELEILYLLQEKDFDKNTCTEGFIQQVVEQAPKAISIIEKQQKEIEELKEQFNIVDHECSRLEKIDIEKDLELQKKDKQIDLMCEQLVGEYIWSDKKNGVVRFSNEEEVKQYFEKETE